MASGTDTGAIISVNQTSDKAVFYLRPDGAFNCIPTINETGADYDLYDYASTLTYVYLQFFAPLTPSVALSLLKFLTCDI
jgi:hypothetical protein